ncbi:SNF2 family N-terminal domain-containing protein [Mycena epipterygia]|nr:SNF2 family N-terminal domain-containing protein [Mycena epipterygia]
MNRKSPKAPKIQRTQDTSDSKAYCDTDSPSFLRPFTTTDAPDEEIRFPDFAPERSLTPKEAEAALRDLFEHGTDDSSTPINDADAVVAGFRPEIRLMTHQILSRAWMRDREDSTKKKAGGILADDMGVGKTIQATTRVVDAPLSKRDAEDGWKKATLVVCPLALVQQWDDEIKKLTVGLNVLQYHGPKRHMVAHRLPDADIVLTTYGIVCSEHSEVNPGDTKKGSVLFTAKWLRIILDEAHTIKNRKSKTAEACCDLRAKYRWCLTATPMQNKIEDFFPLLQFLRIKPLNDWDRFNSLIAKPITKGVGAGLAMKRLQVVLKHVMLRRTKAQLVSTLKLPGRSVHMLPCKFESTEAQFYIALKTNVQTLLRKILAKGENGGKTYMNILVLLLRLRQACDHPCLFLDSYADAMDDIAPEPVGNMFKDAELEDDDGKLKCQVCMSRLTSRNKAAKEWPCHCINCAAFKVQAQNLHSPMRASTKIRTILQLLKHIAHVSDGQEKTVIFSQFTAMLDVIEPFLIAIGLGFVRYDGSMSPKERKEALTDIATNHRKTVMLVSLKAGGVGLNLTACNHVILVDMWWNPAVEEQAFDRTHRVGQTRNVHIYKLKIDNTVEDRILQLQEKKRELTKMALSGDQIKNMKLGMNELLELFK